ncbi:hypothetical protein DFR57_10618 [Saliterribacillus persicus]|uniref:Uncharacterized protein n=1 Tax=Saliterribacillus persicus TaxID=930114 RepID=A0A368XRM6_9BACI|nr:hypothetical protein DFR57_10618 [Saliterribacillus persicus]
MAGRKKEPLSVIQGKGRSNHITKEEALRCHTDNIEPPRYLLKSQTSFRD